MLRTYERILKTHLTSHRQMAFVTGPRQVGKTTVCRGLTKSYMSFDDRDDRRLVQAGPRAVADKLGLQIARRRPLTVTFDEIHKFGKWKSFLKGFFDLFENQVRILVTGSTRLDVYRRGGDSLMGRYFIYRMHPLSIGELVRTVAARSEISAPRQIAKPELDALWNYGGFPEPFLKRADSFHRRWRATRRDQLVREDVRDLTRVQELGQLDTLVTLLEERSGQQLIYSNLAGELGVAIETIRRWLDTLEGLYVGFRVRPWFTNVAKALRKEPKWYSFDWSTIDDLGARTETFAACHLLKAVQTWNDLGLGQFELRYLRDKLKREVDFLIIRNRKPWFLVEVKASDTQLSPALAYFQAQTGASHAFQAVRNLDFDSINCFELKKPMVVPLHTLLSQLP